MAQIIIEVLDVPRVDTAYATVYPIPLDDEGSTQYTLQEWTQEVLRQHVVDTVYRYDKQVAGSAVVKDDTVAS